MESSKQVIILPKINKKPPTKQKVKKAKRKCGTNSFYLWSRGNSKKKNKICIGSRPKTAY